MADTPEAKNEKNNGITLFTYFFSDREFCLMITDNISIILNLLSANVKSKYILKFIYLLKGIGWFIYAAIAVNAIAMATACAASSLH